MPSNDAPRNDRYDSMYPAELNAAERELIDVRRTAAGVADPTKPVVAFALSGGGIRSATFCLGVFQGLAKKGLIRDIDMISSVSGGGYFAGFLGRLFTRPTGAGAKNKVADVEARLGKDKAFPESFSVYWLRESGRYLAPNGSGDSQFDLAVLLRNWCALTFVLATFFLTVFLLGAAARHALWNTTSFWPDAVETWLASHADAPLWWSPFAAIPLASFLVAVIPLGWAFWLPEAGRCWHKSIPHLATCATSVVSLAWALSHVRADARGASFYVAAGLAVASTLTVIWWAKAQSASSSKRSVGRVRNHLTKWLGHAVVFTGATLALGLVDSAAQTIYAVLTASSQTHTGIFASIAAGVGAIVVGGRRLVSMFSDEGGKKRVKLPVALLAGAAAALVVVVFLTSLGLAAHALLWGGRTPRGDPGVKFMEAHFPQPPQVDLSMEGHVVVNPPSEYKSSAGDVPDPWLVFEALAAAALVSVTVGSTIGFLNLSSYQQLYAARLARAYLGASNPERESNADKRKLSELVEGDDVPLDEYRPHVYGGPLHVVNVTVNETVSGVSQVEQRDRKGLPMAVGPCGLSAGLRYHALWTDYAGSGASESGGESKQRDRAIRPLVADADSFHLFARRHAKPKFWRTPLKWARSKLPAKFRADPVQRVECPTTGGWIAISGAAFSTGLGARTSVGLSVLAGVGNVRLGYWWDSHIDPSERAGRAKTDLAGRASRVLNRLFPTQVHLIEECLAKFHGPGRRRWYLTDGGHYENTGCYELIRRRVPLIVCCDDGADPDYEFQDVSNLVRMARTDFGAEIEFLDEAALNKLVASPARESFGTVQELRREKRRADDAAPAGGFRGSRYSKKRAAIARVKYDGESEPRTTIVFLKPSMVGDEPVDVLEYQRSHEDFPQEPTADQFFDEAQWESYRKLGEHVATKVFAKSDDATKWTPATMRPPQS